MIGERLYDLRKDRELSQEELGKLLNINKHSISSYERDKSEPPDDIKIRLAKFFNVSVDYLLGLTDYPGSYSSDRRVIVLPANFSLSDEEAVKHYIGYLEYLHKRKP